MAKITFVNQTLLDCGVQYDLSVIKGVLFWCSGVAAVLTSSFGVIGNLLSILVLTQKSMASLFNHLLLSLCLSDITFLLTSLVMSPIAMGYNQLYPAELYHVSECVCHVALASSIFLTTCLSVEMYQAVYDPYSYQARMVSTSHKTLLAYYVLPSVIFASLLNIPRWIAVSSLGHTLQQDAIYLKFLFLFQLIHPITTLSIAPAVALAVLSFRICRSELTNKDLHLTGIAAILSIVCLVLNSPRLILAVYEISRYNLIVDCFNSPATSYRGPEWQLVMDIVARYMAVINSSTKFIIYCVAGRQFRSVLAILLHRKSETNINKLAEELTTVQRPRNPSW